MVHVYCQYKAHKEESDIDLKNKKYKFVGCTTIPFFGPEGGKAIWCSTHKQTDDINLKDKQCEFLNCKTKPNYGPKDSTTTGLTLV
jgi:hypothetical protein